MKVVYASFFTAIVATEPTIFENPLEVARQVGKTYDEAMSQFESPEFKQQMADLEHQMEDSEQEIQSYAEKLQEQMKEFMNEDGSLKEGAFEQAKEKLIDLFADFAQNMSFDQLPEEMQQLAEKHGVNADSFELMKDQDLLKTFLSELDVEAIKGFAEGVGVDLGEFEKQYEQAQEKSEKMMQNLEKHEGCISFGARAAQQMFQAQAPAAEPAMLAFAKATGSEMIMNGAEQAAESMKEPIEQGECRPSLSLIKQAASLKLTGAERQLAIAANNLFDLDASVVVTFKEQLQLANTELQKIADATKDTTEETMAEMGANLAPQEQEQQQQPELHNVRMHDNAAPLAQ